MHLTALFVATLLQGISSAAPSMSTDTVVVRSEAVTTGSNRPVDIAAVAATECSFGAAGEIYNTDAMGVCLNNYRVFGWSDYDCSGHIFFRGGSLWSSPEDCQKACASCLSDAIYRNAASVTCDTWAGAAHCWMGFY